MTLFSSAFNLAPPLPKAEVRKLSPAALAYLGDSVYELFVRLQYLSPPTRLQAYHKNVVSQVRAEAQAAHIQRLQDILTDAEQAILRQGRNAATGHPKRLSPSIYQSATGLEALIGYLYLTDQYRLLSILAHLETQFKSSA